MAWKPLVYLGRISYGLYVFHLLALDKQRGRFFPKRLYKLRGRIEQTIGKLKRFKRVAMRCEKTDTSYSAIISFACGLMLVKSVHTA